MFWDICTRIARLTKQLKLVPGLFSKSVPFVPCRGDASKRRKIFSIWPINLKVTLATIACVPTAWYKRDGFTENIWYKLRLLSQPSNTRTNIPKHASGPISWLIPKCKRYALRPPQILIGTTITPLIGCLICIGQFSQKSPMNSGSFAKNDLQLKSYYGSSPPCTTSRRALAMSSPHTLQYTASHGKTLQHTARHCNTLQHTATHCNAVQHTAIHLVKRSRVAGLNTVKCAVIRYPYSIQMWSTIGLYRSGAGQVQITNK